MPEDTEFAAKWAGLCAAHLSDEGIRDPIKCYEYLGNFYVQEGNKRVSVLKSYEAALKRAAQAEIAILFYENEHATTLRMALESKAFQTISLMTGPEGGLEAAEVDRAREAGLEICTLGSRILRCETAPLCALSAVMYHIGEF